MTIDPRLYEHPYTDTRKTDTVNAATGGGVLSLVFLGIALGILIPFVGCLLADLFSN